MPTTLRRVAVARGSFVAVMLAVSAGLAGCDGDTADLVRELEAARGDCTMDAMRASSEECVRMFERYAEIGSEAINTYIGGVRALDEALRRGGGFSLDTAGLPRALSGEFLPDGSRSADPGGTSVWPGTYADGVRGAYDGSDPGSYSGWPDPYADPSTSVPYAGPPADPDAGAYPRPQRGVLLPPDVRLRRPWIEPEADGWELERGVDRDPGDWPAPGYGLPPGGATWGYPGSPPVYGAPPGYGYPPGYSGYGYPPYGTVPGVPGYQGYPAPPGYHLDPRLGGYPVDRGYPGYGTVPGGAYPGLRDPRYDSRYGADSRWDDRTNQRTPRAYDP